jgi:hypothetical protein
MLNESDQATPSDRPKLYIINSGEDEDRQLAERIALETRDIVTPIYMTPNELIELELTAFLPAFLPVPTVHAQAIKFLILSPAIANAPGHCTTLAKLVRSDSLFLREESRVYCFCRGIARDVLQEHKELGPILENVFVGFGGSEQGKDGHLQLILGEIREFVTQTMPTIPRRSLFLEVLSNLYYMFVAFLTMVMFYLAPPLSACAAVLLTIFWWLNWSPSWSMALVCLCAFTAGYRLNRLLPSDIWPWLGRRWKLPRDVMSESACFSFRGPLFLTNLLFAIISALQSDWSIAWSWFLNGIVTQALVDYLVDRQCRAAFNRRSGYSDAAISVIESLGRTGPSLSNCRVEEFIAAGSCAVTAALWSAIGLACGIALLIVPCVLIGRQDYASVMPRIAVSVVVGLLLPTILAVFAGRVIIIRSGAYVGLFNRSVGTPKARVPLAMLKGAVPCDRLEVESFAQDLHQVQVLNWLFLLRGAEKPLRPNWAATADYAFLSYLWGDDGGMSARLAEACTTAGVGHFLDKENAEEFGLFRRGLAEGIAKCTHFFLVLSPKIVDPKRYIHREIEMAMGLWDIEMLPAIICVVEPDLAERLRTDPAVSLEIRFLLTFCPQMTPTEAAQPAIVRYIVEFTRREGKLHDWLALLSPATAYVRAVRLPGIGEASSAAVAPIS